MKVYFQHHKPGVPIPAHFTDTQEIPVLPQIGDKVMLRDGQRYKVVDRELCLKGDPMWEIQVVEDHSWRRKPIFGKEEE